VSKNVKADFSIIIDFDKGAPNPSRIFSAMSMLIQSFEAFDKDLVSHIGNNIDTVMVLEDIEIGSLKTWLAQVIKKIPDSAIEDLDWKKAIGHYLVKGKYILLNNLEGKVTLTDGNKEIEVIEMELIKAANETGVDQLPTYVPTSKKSIISHIDQITKAVEPLTGNDKVSFESSDGNATFNIDFFIDVESMEDLMVAETIVSENTMILKVKRPDYLGDSKWSFKHGSETISAKIMHREWLIDFQRRKIDVRPQDSLVCRVQITVKYDDRFEVLSKSYDIIEVIKIKVTTYLCNPLDQKK